MRILKPLLTRDVPVELETRDRYLGPFFRPERKLSQAVFNITIQVRGRKGQVGRVYIYLACTRMFRLSRLLYLGI